MDKENVNPTPEEEIAEQVETEAMVEEAEAEPAEAAEADGEESPAEAEAAEADEEMAEGAESTEEEAPAEAEAEDIDIEADEYTYTPRVKNKKAKKGFKAGYIIAPIAAVAVLVGAFLALPMTIAKDTIANNVWVRDIDLSGLTAQEAEELLATNYEPTEKQFSVIFESEGRAERTAFTAEEIEFATDIKGTVADAYAVGREDNYFKNAWGVLRGFFVKSDIGARPSYNDEALSNIFYELGARINGEGEDVKVEIADDLLTITPAKPGQSHNVDAAKAEFEASVRKGITADIPLTLKSNEADKLDVDEIYAEYAVEAKDAEYVIEGNDVIVTDHIVGVEIDKAKLSALIEQVNNGVEGNIPVTITMPAVTNEALQNSLFGTTLATYSSNYSSSSANRAYNVELAASKINGIILADGAEFSYNGTVGNANAANGFKMATVFSDGKKTEGIGGGVCQVSSTLYCSVLRADLEVVERKNHSLPIAYVPGGQDATVAYGAIDFRFRNNTGAPIKIVATSAGRNLTVSILGAASAKKNVEVVSQKVSHLAPVMTEIPDPTLPVGTTEIVSKGSAGSVYVVYKRVFDANGSLIKETSTRSTYRATPGEIKVGTGEAVPGTDVPAVSPENPEVTPNPGAEIPPTENEAPPTETDTPAPEVSAPDEYEEPEIGENGYPAGL